MRNANKDIKGYAKQKRVYQYEIAEELCISESALSRYLRKELDIGEKEKITTIIDKLSSKLL